MANQSALQNSTVNLNGGALTFDPVVAGNAFTFGGLTGSGDLALLNNNGQPIILTVGNNGSSNTYSGKLSGVLGGLTLGGITPLTFTLSGANTYTGPTTLKNGTLSLGSAGALGMTSTISFTGGTLQFTTANTTDYSSQFSSIGLGSYRIDTNGQNVTFASSLNDPNASLTKLGAGTLKLSAANAFTGQTTVNAGTLDVANQLALQNSLVNLNGGAVIFDSVAGTAFNFGGLTGNGNLTLANNAASPAPTTLSVGNSNAVTTYTGVLSGAGALTVTGTGTLTVTGANTYTGATNVSSGTLQVGNGATGNLLGTSGITVASGGTLILDLPAGTTFSTNIDDKGQINTTGATGTNDFTLADVISDTGSLTATGTNTVTVTGANTYSGGTTVSSGTLQLGNGVAAGATLGHWECDDKYRQRHS